MSHQIPATSARRGSRERSSRPAAKTYRSPKPTSGEPPHRLPHRCRDRRRDRNRSSIQAQMKRVTSSWSAAGRPSPAHRPGPWDGQSRTYYSHQRTVANCFSMSSRNRSTSSSQNSRGRSNHHQRVRCRGRSEYFAVDPAALRRIRICRSRCSSIASERYYGSSGSANPVGPALGSTSTRSAARSSSNIGSLRGRRRVRRERSGPADRTTVEITADFSLAIS